MRLLKIQSRDLLFITAEQVLFTHSSLVSIQSVLVSSLVLYGHDISANGPS